MRFFLDNNLARRHAEVLRVLVAPDGHHVAHLQEMFAPSTPDEKWIGALGAERDWVLISGDRRIATHPHLREAWKNAHLTSFFLLPAWMKTDLNGQHWRLVKYFPRLVIAARRAALGSKFFVRLNGKIQRVSS